MPKLRKPGRRTRAAEVGMVSIREVCLFEATAGRSGMLAAGDRLRRGGRAYRVTTVHQAISGRGYVHLESLGDSAGFRS